MVTYLGSLVESCWGEGGTLQTHIAGMCGDCSHCMDYSGFAPVHNPFAFLVYTAQAPSRSAGNSPKQALGFVQFPGLSCSGLGS